MSCDNKTDFMYPLVADVFFPKVEQTGFGSVEKTWVLDKTISCSLGPIGKRARFEVQPSELITIDKNLYGMTRCDPRLSSNYGDTSITNIIISNVRDANGNLVYRETSGVRSGKGTIFELSTVEPMIGPFGTVEYFKIVIRRSDNQGTDV